MDKKEFSQNAFISHLQAQRKTQRLEQVPHSTIQKIDEDRKNLLNTTKQSVYVVNKFKVEEVCKNGR